ncbi:hypothetical protein K491DRAFT_685177 [Lophiostoma macrostomum CBS 122681]|uniref:Uncharacterized protein n=1 Tax=Lophiostoma macrostomum CBS 122681 TaxID=1314788 RepID=A0A6A6SJE3_9PLEO|nr:hypothetical protein K491DRAFT_685177 [Lophiostoma macrostomum CBS 122681]
MYINWDISAYQQNKWADHVSGSVYKSNFALQQENYRQRFKYNIATLHHAIGRGTQRDCEGSTGGFPQERYQNRLKHCSDDERGLEASNLMFKDLFIQIKEAAEGLGNVQGKILNAWSINTKTQTGTSFITAKELEVNLLYLERKFVLESFETLLHLADHYRLEPHSTSSSDLETARKEFAETLKEAKARKLDLVRDEHVTIGEGLQSEERKERRALVNG